MPSVKRTSEVVFCLRGVVYAVQNQIKAKFTCFVLYALKNLDKKVICKERNDGGDSVGLL
ncbi:MAG: hypothetical protein HW407_2237 [Bacteroidetes bacterium]|nr:hypothetical protein [Bacteroidota bacterium]